MCWRRGFPHCARGVPAAANSKPYRSRRTGTGGGARGVGEMKGASGVELKGASRTRVECRRVGHWDVRVMRGS
jgi:hypothetical protein